MNAEELKQALMKKQIVNFKGVDYMLNGIIYRAKDGKITVSAELLKGNFVVIANANELRREK